MSIASELYGKQQQLANLIKNSQDKSSPQFLSDLSSLLSEMEQFIQWPFKLAPAYLYQKDFVGNWTILRQREAQQCGWNDAVKEARAAMESAKALLPKPPEPTEADRKAWKAKEDYAKIILGKTRALNLQFLKFKSWYSSATDPKKYNEAFDSLKEKHQLLQEEEVSWDSLSDFQYSDYLKVTRDVRDYLEDNEKLRKQNEEKLARAAVAGAGLQAAVAVALDGGQPAAAAAGAGAGAQAPAVAPVLAFSGAANAAASAAQAAGAAAAPASSSQDPKVSLGGAKP